MSHIYNIRWEVPVTIGDGHVLVTSSHRLPAAEAAHQAALRLAHLAERCPAGGILPTPHEGERFAISHEGRIYAGDDLLPAAEPRLKVDLVLLDKHGTPYDPSEVALTRPQRPARVLR